MSIAMPHFYHEELQQVMHECVEQECMTVRLTKVCVKKQQQCHLHVP